MSLNNLSFLAESPKQMLMKETMKDYIAMMLLT